MILEVVILNEVKNLSSTIECLEKQILRFAQDDNLIPRSSFGVGVAIPPPSSYVRAWAGMVNERNTSSRCPCSTDNSTTSQFC